jgi:lathosterol oxidase
MFGSGWLRGISLLLLAAIGLLSVLCLNYPDILTVPEIQAAIEVSFLRLIIKIVLIVGIALSFISLIILSKKRKKRKYAKVLTFNFSFR